MIQKSDDIDGTLARIESLDGKTLLPKTEIPMLAGEAFSGIRRGIG